MKSYAIKTDELCEACSARTGEHLVVGDRLFVPANCEEIHVLDKASARLLLCDVCRPHVVEAEAVKATWSE